MYWNSKPDCCPRDCPNRTPTCHNDSCPQYKAHEEAKKERYERAAAEAARKDINTAAGLRIQNNAKKGKYS